MAKIFHDGNYYTEEEMRTIVNDYYFSVYSRKNDRHVKMQELFPEDLTNKSKILDYGCGMGSVSKFFYDTYKCEIDAVDLSENELRKAKIAFGDSDINFMLLNEFKFPHNHYDLILSL